MLNRNTKYTAEEILTEAGVTDLDKVFGKARVRIAGLRGIVKPEHLIKIPANADSPISVVVGNETFEIELANDVPENSVITEKANKTLEAKGKELTEKHEAILKAKEEAKETE